MHRGTPCANIKNIMQNTETRNDRVTTQLTSKRLKAHKAVACLVVFLGVCLLLASGYRYEPSASMTMAGWAAISGGFLWVLVTEIRIWWHHG